MAEDVKDLLERAVGWYEPAEQGPEGPRRRAERRHGRQRVMAAVVAFALFAAAGAFTWGAFRHTGAVTSPGASPIASPHRITLTTISLDREGVAGIGFDGTTLWVCTAPPGGGIGDIARLWPVDPTTGKPTGSPFKLQSCATGSPVFADGDLWIDGISRIDLQTGRTTALPVEGSPEAFWDGSVWATGRAGVVRIDPVTNRVQAVVFAQRWAGRFVIDQGDIWFVRSASVYRVDPATDQIIATIRLPGFSNAPGEVHINAMAAGDGAVWAASAGAGTLLRIDPATNRVTAVVHTGARNLLGVVAAGGRVWAIGTRTIARNTTEQLWEVDPSSNRTLGQGVTILPPGHLGFPIVAAGGSLWVGDLGDQYPGRAGFRLVKIDFSP